LPIAYDATIHATSFFCWFSLHLFKDFWMECNTLSVMTNQATPDRARAKAYLSRRLPDAVELRVAERYEVVRNPEDTVLSPVALAEAAEGCEYILTSAMQPVPREVFQKLKGTLKAIGTLSVGYNHIDLDAAQEFGVAVFYSPGVLSDACAELGIMLLLNAARRGYEADTMMRAGSWTGFAPTQLLGVGLTGRRAGILGMGRIGQAIARRLQAFGVELHYHNRSRLDAQMEGNAIYHDSPEDLLSVSDFLFLLAPGSPELVRFLNRERIALLPKDAIVVNISRGDTVDDDALIEALQSGRIFAAGLDVFSGEPAFAPRYRALTNVFLTPHIASATVDARNAMGFLVLDGLLAYERGQKAENQLC
jgi:lactate dehydrogenase-like 2-hydroxyacid dehydrogenase